MSKCIFVLGCPGAGKGTQCEKLANEFGKKYTRNECKKHKTTLETSGEDVKTTLETSGEDVKTTLETSGEDVKTTLETSGEDDKKIELRIYKGQGHSFK
jgi:broad-specificity NMP kinase